MEHATLQPPKTPRPAQDASPLFIPVCVAMLACGMMVSGIVPYGEHQIRTAGESVIKALATPKAAPQAETLADDGGVALNEAQFFHEITALASGFVPQETQTIHTSGDRIEIIVPQSHTFAPGKPELRPLNLPFFEKIAHALGQWQHGLRIEMEILVSQPSPPAQEALAPLAMERAATLVKTFEARSVAKDSVSVGQQYSDADTLTLRFHVRDSVHASVQQANALSRQ